MRSAAIPVIRATIVGLGFCVCLAGCASRQRAVNTPDRTESLAATHWQSGPESPSTSQSPQVAPVGLVIEAVDTVRAEDSIGVFEELPKPDAVVADDVDRQVTLDDVVNSVHQAFPLVAAAFLERDRTAGDQLAAWGEFDTKWKLSSENEPLGFYENYRQKTSLTQPVYAGGELFGGYRIGRGSFEPWYLERETNKGGEFKAGVLVPLARDRDIDRRRAELWRATYDRQLAEPDIQQQLIGFVRDGSVAFWSWVAAGQRLRIGQAALQLAEQRNAALERRVEEGDLDPPVLRDNERAIAERTSDLIDQQRQLQQAAVTLSLFLRTSDAAPLVPEPSQVIDFPEPISWDPARLEKYVSDAISRRPELVALDTLARRVRVDLAEGLNDLKPDVDLALAGSQDVGEPTSSLRDKSEFELEAGLFFELPLQRRKGTGKIRSARAKLGQLDAKRIFTVNKITAEVQSSVAAIAAAYDQVSQARESLRLARELAQIERRKFELGESDLLAVFLREQFAIEAANGVVSALLKYHVAESELNAALGVQWPQLR